jgi:hypothetical protein
MQSTIAAHLAKRVGTGVLSASIPPALGLCLEKGHHRHRYALIEASWFRRFWGIAHATAKHKPMISASSFPVRAKAQAVTKELNVESAHRKLTAETFKLAIRPAFCDLNDEAASVTIELDSQKVDSLAETPLKVRKATREAKTTQFGHKAIFER